MGVIVGCFLLVLMCSVNVYADVNMAKTFPHGEYILKVSYDFDEELAIVEGNFEVVGGDVRNPEYSPVDDGIIADGSLLDELEIDIMVFGIKNIKFNEGITRIGNENFKDFVDIENVILPDSLKEIGSSAFEGCTSLKSINIPDSVKVIEESTFEGCTNLFSENSLKFPNGLEEIKASAFKNCNYPSGGLAIEIPSSIKRIGKDAFVDTNSNNHALVIIENIKGIEEINPSAIMIGAGSNNTLLYNADNEIIKEMGSQISYSSGFKTAAFATTPKTSGNEGNYSWSYNTDTKTLTIEGSGSISFENDGLQPWYPAFYTYGNAELYIINEGITELGNHFFTKAMSKEYVDVDGIIITHHLITIGAGIVVQGPAELEDNIKSLVPEATFVLLGEEIPPIEEDPTDEDVNDIGSVDIILDAEPTMFKVTVPIVFVVNMTKTGASVADLDYKVENLCPIGPILIKAVEVVTRPDWSLADYDADFKNMAVNSKSFGLSLNGAKASNTTNTIELNDSLKEVIRNKEYKELTFDVKLSAQNTVIDKLNIGALIFTVDFDKVED